jgi:hypothetical protein
MRYLARIPVFLSPRYVLSLFVENLLLFWKNKKYVSSLLNYKCKKARFFGYCLSVSVHVPKVL